MSADRSVLRDRALELRAAGNGYRLISRTLGVPHTTVVRWVNPTYAENSRAASRAAKENQRGVCERCGGPTSWAGGAGKPKSAAMCLSCRNDEREPEHGNYVRYNSEKWKCRCADCRAAWATHMREYRRARRAAA